MGARKQAKAKPRKRTPRKQVLKEGLSPVPTSRKDRQQAMAHGNQRALLAEVAQSGEAVSADTLLQQPHVRQMIKEELANLHQGNGKFPFEAARSINLPSVAGLGQVNMAPPPPADAYQATREQINERWERVLTARKNMDAAIQRARHADPHDPGHLAIVQELRECSIDYIFASQDLIRAANFNEARAPQAAQVGGQG